MKVDQDKAHVTLEQVATDTKSWIRLFLTPQSRLAGNQNPLEEADLVLCEYLLKIR